MLFDNLTQFDPAGRLEPGLATRWEADSTGARYTFHLRAGATFHDGSPITAASVRASFLRVLRLASKGSRTWTLTPIKGAAAFAAGTAPDVEGIAVPDDSTMVFTLEEPLNIFPKLLAMPAAAVVPATVGAGFSEAPVGSGPWRFVAWSHDDELLVAANPTYWAGRPLVATRCGCASSPSRSPRRPSTSSDSLRSWRCRSARRARWEAEHAPELQRRAALRALYVAINTRRGPLQDVRVRRALNLAVDAGTMLRTIMAGPRRPRRGRDPARHRGIRQQPRPLPARPRGGPGAAGRGRATPTGSRSSSGAPSAPSSRGSRRPSSRAWPRWASRWRSSSATPRAPRAASAQGRGRPLPDRLVRRLSRPRELQLSHSSIPATRAAAGTAPSSAIPSTDRMILVARRTPNAVLKDSLSRAIDARVFEAAPWIFCWFPVDLWAERPDVEGWRGAGHLQRPALAHREADRRDALPGRPPPAGPPDALRRARGRLPAPERGPGRSGAGHGGRARRLARRSCGCAPSSTSTIRCPGASSLYAAGVLRGDLGSSYITRRPILRDLLHRFPYTLRLALAAMLFAVSTGLAIGILGALAPRQLVRSLHDAGRVSRRLVPGLLGGAAAHPGVRRQRSAGSRPRVPAGSRSWSCRP